MFKKIISLLTIITFVIFSYSCASYSVQKKSIDTIDISSLSKLRIVGVQTKSGEDVGFLWERPASINYNAVVGKTITRKEVVIKKTDIKIHRKSSLYKEFDLIQTKDGKTYETNSYQINSDSIVINQYLEGVSIPLEQVDLIWVLKDDSAKVLTAFLVVGIVGILIAFASVIRNFNMNLGFPQ